MQEISSVSFSGVFALRDGVSEEEFFPRLHAFFRHFIEMGFATGYRVMRREALDGFGKTLPAFTYRGELFYPDLEREHAAYEYVKQHGGAGKLAACSDELIGQTRRRLLLRDAHRIEDECLPLPVLRHAGACGRRPLSVGKQVIPGLLSSAYRFD